MSELCDGVFFFYCVFVLSVEYCLVKFVSLGVVFVYNNCDYFVVMVGLYGFGVMIWLSGMVMVCMGEKGVFGFVGGKFELVFEFVSWGVVGGLMGIVWLVFVFDCLLMVGKLFLFVVFVEFWKLEGKGSY